MVITANFAESSTTGDGGVTLTEGSSLFGQRTEGNHFPEMKIVFLAWRDLANPLAGGSEILIDRLASGLVARGHDVTLIAGGPVEHRDYKTVDAGGVLGQYLKGPLIALRHHRDADVVVDVCNGLPFFSPLWRRKPTITLVNHVHTAQWELWFPPVRAWIGRAVESRLMPRLYRGRPFMAVSPSTASALEAIGVPAANIHIIPNGVFLPDGRPVPPSGDPVFVALGRLVPHKRYDLLLDVWEKVRPITGGRLVIAGEGPEMERLRETAGEAVDLTGHITDEDKQDLLARATCLIHPALLEGWGLVIMEAAAHGTPALGFRVPGVRDSIADGVSGVLVDTSAELAEAWIRITLDRSHRAQLSRGAYARAAEFSWNKTVDNFEALAEESVSGQRAPASATPTALGAPRLVPLKALVTCSPTRPTALSIVIPAFNEAERLPATLAALRRWASGRDIEILVVDDGSRDGTVDAARRGLAGHPASHVIAFPVQRGKGAAVRAGVRRATGQAIAFMDADLATDLKDLDVLWRALDHSHIAIGSRSAPGAVTIGGSAYRAVMGRTFNHLARTATGVDIRDFQCGLKVFRGHVARLLFHLTQTEGFAFDVEVLSLAARIGYRVAELPVCWQAVPGSHIKPIRHSLQMASDVARLPLRRSSNHSVAALAAFGHLPTDGASILEVLDPFLSQWGPLVTWRRGALALLPFKEMAEASDLIDDLRAELPQLRIEPSSFTSRQLLRTSDGELRIALAAG